MSRDCTLLGRTDHSSATLSQAPLVLGCQHKHRLRNITCSHHLPFIPPRNPSRGCNDTQSGSSQESVPATAREWLLVHRHYLMFVVSSFRPISIVIRDVAVYTITTYSSHPVSRVEKRRQLRSVLLITHKHLYSYIRTRSRAFQFSAKSREQFIRHSDRHYPRLNYSDNMASAPFLLVEFLRSVNLRGCPIWGCVDSHPSRRVDQAVPEKAAIPHGIRKV